MGCLEAPTSNTETITHTTDKNISHQQISYLKPVILQRDPEEDPVLSKHYMVAGAKDSG